MGFPSEGGGGTLAPCSCAKTDVDAAVAVAVAAVMAGLDSAAVPAPFAAGELAARRPADLQEMIFSPGATRSGLRRPSPVGPLDEKYETP